MKNSICTTNNIKKLNIIVFQVFQNPFATLAQDISEVITNVSVEENEGLYYYDNKRIIHLKDKFFGEKKISAYYSLLKLKNSDIFFMCDKVENIKLISVQSVFSLPSVITQQNATWIWGAINSKENLTLLVDFYDNYFN